MKLRFAVSKPLMLLLALGALAAGPPVAEAKLRVAASLNDLASIAASVGGDQVEVFSIARPNSDVHRVEVLPSYMVKVARAQVYLKVGLGLDQWADQIIDGSRNQRVQIVDCSQGVTILEKPSGKVDASMGDVHPNGNPHYWLDPRNGAVIAATIAEALSRQDPAHAAQFRERAEAFGKSAQETWEQGRRLAEAMPSKTILTYHRSWPYFANAFGLEIVGTIEPVPGIPPTARHLAELVRIVKARGVRLLLQEPYFSGDAGKFLARQTNLRVVVAAPLCDAPTAGSYLAHFATVLRQLGAPTP